MIGKSISHYRIIEQLGTGGMDMLQCKTAAYSDYSRGTGTPPCTGQVDAFTIEMKSPTCLRRSRWGGELRRNVNLSLSPFRLALIGHLAKFTSLMGQTNPIHK